ncbi:glutamate cyclase domain-containing protein [Micromonospora haikouensis]|uniref:glutamate cyclase domain-containing protein n=1 Tax=Micromonospora haikouensis TaxID=686309 RepID=UPI003423D469
MTTAATPQQAVWRKGDMIDRLVSLDFPRRGVIDLIYRAAREHHGAPLSTTAAHLLRQRLTPGRVALIATGWLDRPHVSRLVAENDGPPGAALLARALHAGLGAVPVILVEREIVDGTRLAVQAAGLRCLSPQEAVEAAASTARLHAAAVVAFPSDPAAAEQVATDLCDSLDVGAFVAIEKGGRNEQGRIHTSRGDDTTAPLAKVDALLDVCRARNIASVGVGDGGNEIGMGTIRDRLRPELRFGQRCRCECGGGVVPSNPTDVVVAATVSNWGAYGIAAALAVLLDRPEVMHTEELEEDVLRACALGGFIDGVTGYVGPTADGLPLRVHRAVVTMLRAVVGVGVNSAAWS